MNYAISRLLDELRTGLALLYSNRLRGIYLFGSVSRGEADAESDIDILIVLDRVDNYGQEVECTSHLISRLSLFSVNTELLAGTPVISRLAWATACVLA